MKKIIILLMLPIIALGQYTPQDSVYDVSGDIRYWEFGDSAIEIKYKTDAMINEINDTLPNSIVDSIVNALNSVDSIVFSEQSTSLEWLKWKMFADSAKHTVSLHMDAENVTLQIGMEMYIYARNVSGAAMPNFTAARIVGSTGEWANMDICGIGSVDSARFVGLATHDIPNNEFGFFTTYGSSREGNSSFLTQGKRVYLSHAGGLRSDTVDYPYEMFQVGFCIRSHISEGEILVQPMNTTLNHPSGSVLYINGNREEASDTSVIKKQNGQIIIDTANVNTYTDGNNSYTLSDLIDIDTVKNLGNGTDVVTQSIDTILAKSLVEGTNVTITSDVNEVIINSVGDGIDSTYYFAIALSDSSTELTTANGDSWDALYNYTIDSIRIGVNTPPTGSTLSVDIKKNGTSIFGTLITIDAGDSTSVGATTPYVLSTTTINFNDRMQAIANGVGATFGGAGLKVYIYGKREY